jgi:hypothetical protein
LHKSRRMITVYKRIEKVVFLIARDSVTMLPYILVTEFNFKWILVQIKVETHLPLEPCDLVDPLRLEMSVEG